MRGVLVLFFCISATRAIRPHAGTVAYFSPNPRNCSLWEVIKYNCGPIISPQRRNSFHIPNVSDVFKSPYTNFGPSSGDESSAQSSITSTHHIQNFTNGYEDDEFCVYDLRMSYIWGAPDGVEKRMIAFNGQFPGPVITCTKGKTLVVRITNDISTDEPTSIHWHGITQILSPFYDGPQSVTQCPIIKDTSMIYKFKLYQSGTYWYHSHHAYQYVDGCWGFLIVKNNPRECWQNSYDDERLISINDWIHRDAKNISEVYLADGDQPSANSSMINGRGSFNCSNVEPGEVCSTDLQGPAVVNVTQGKRYRFRILNSSGLLTYNFSIDAHQFVVIETDGVDTVKSPKVDVMTVYPGQRFSIIVIMDQPLDNYWIRIVGFPASPDQGNALAILQYEENPDGVPAYYDEPTEPDTTIDQGRPHYTDVPWDDIMHHGGISVPTRHELLPYFPHEAPEVNTGLQLELDIEHAELLKTIEFPTTTPVDPDTAILLDDNDVPPLELPGVDGSAPNYYDRLVVINVTNCHLPGSNGARMCMNGAPFVPAANNAPPVLFQIIQGTPLSDTIRPIYTPNLREVIRVVINNQMPETDFESIPHPWHLHGHSFWVLGIGEKNAGDFDPIEDAGNLTTNGVRRDTVGNFVNSWTVITYITDNPGPWILHCHISWHLEAGLAVNMIESENIAKHVYKYPPRASLETCARVGVTLN